MPLLPEREEARALPVEGAGPERFDHLGRLNEALQSAGRAAGRAHSPDSIRHGQLGTTPGPCGPRRTLKRSVVGKGEKRVHMRDKPRGHAIPHQERRLRVRSMSPAVGDAHGVRSGRLS